MSNDPIQQRLGALPTPPLPDDLWPRLLARRERNRNRLRWAAAGGVALLACLLLVTPPITAPPGHPSADAIATAPGLPAASMSPAPTPPVPADPAPSDAIAAIDRALQIAYSRGATDADVAPLWEIRRHLAANKALSDGAGQS